MPEAAMLSMEPPAPTPVTIISGFLGAGKTTLVNRLLVEAPLRLAVLVNDFADLNIDAALIARAEPDRIALTNGCVCCTLRHDLLAAALKLAADQPDRIVIETSGLSDPFGVMEAFISPDARGRLEVESSVCLVDAAQHPQLDYASGELAIDQAMASDIVLLNKCDLLSEPEIVAVEATLTGAQPAMRLRRTIQAQLPASVLFGNGAVPRGRRPGEPRRDGHAGYIAWTWRSRTELSLEAFKALVRELPAGVLRAKGVLRFADVPGQRAIFQLVGKRSALTFDDVAPPAENQIAAIGPVDDFAARDLDALFNRLETLSLGALEVQ